VLFLFFIMKKLLLLLFSFPLTIFGQALSPGATFGLVTISEGSSEDAIYQIWGHTVLHLRDTEKGIDECYDYGTFNFNQPNFVGKFLKGTLPYQMSIVDFSLLVNHYKENEKRTAQEQILNLSEKQKNDLFIFLKNNYLPENRSYQYRFFYYNCASRIRDIVQQICGESLEFSTQLHADSTFRQWINGYAKEKKPWTDFGMSLALGLPADEKTGWEGAMFLPANLAQGFQNATILHDGIKQPFVKAIHQLTYVPRVKSVKSSWFSPLVCSILLCACVFFFTFYQIRFKSKRLLFDKIFFSILGLMGWFLLGLWFLTDHGVTEKNLNCIWAFPFLFPAIFFLNTKINVVNLFKLYFLANFIMLLTWPFLPQTIPQAVIPIILMALIRIYFILKTRAQFKFLGFI
jgi:Domain of unknown function (DUF4105)